MSGCFLFCPCTHTDLTFPHQVAITSSVSHPNLVQLYTYRVSPIAEGTLTPENSSGQRVKVENVSSITSPRNSDQSDVAAYELLLVLEFCDGGSLRSWLDTHPVAYPTALQFARDIAKGMLHLHRNSILHLDLKAANVLIKTWGADGQVICKVSDFGLSVSLDLETHRTGAAAGTWTHMSPEILMEGKQGKAADVYAFGITLWELFTGQKAFDKIPKMTLGHRVVFENIRPAFPPNTPAGYRMLAERCWHPLANSRPTFEEVLSELELLASQAKGGDSYVQSQQVSSASGEVAVSYFAAELAAKNTADESNAGSIEASVNASWFKNDKWAAQISKANSQSAEWPVHTASGK